MSPKATRIDLFGAFYSRGTHQNLTFSQRFGSFIQDVWVSTRSSCAARVDSMTR